MMNKKTNVEQLPNTRTGNHVVGQLLKSGTSTYPNHYPKTHCSTIPVFHHSNCERSELTLIFVASIKTASGP
jgi:hypothetical protein